MPKLSDEKLMYAKQVHAEPVCMQNWHLPKGAGQI